MIFEKCKETERKKETKENKKSEAVYFNHRFRFLFT